MALSPLRTATGEDVVSRIAWARFGRRTAARSRDGKRLTALPAV